MNEICNFGVFRKNRGSPVRRTGKAFGRSAGFLAGVLLAASSFADEVEFYQTVDRNEVGLEDTVRLTVTSVNAPGSAEVRLPSSNDFEILSQSQSSQTSFQLG